MADVLVVYYSRKGESYTQNGIEVLEKGNTEWAAEFIREALNADLFEIETVRPYPEDYRKCCAQATGEAKANARPEIKGYVEDLSGYDTIFVCYPCWCGTAPMCVFTFLEHYDLTGKKIVPLCTNEGSGMGKSEKDLARSCPGANIAAGLSVRGHQTVRCKDGIMAWAKANK